MKNQVNYFDLGRPSDTELLSPPAVVGTYALILQLKSKKSLTIGKLGLLTFEPGFYVYIGSAFGPGGLQARIKRHGKSIKKQRWHIDYLRRHCRLIEVWFSARVPDLECAWSGRLSRSADCTAPVKKFGSSDCGCYSHLFYCRKKPDRHLLHATQAFNRIRKSV